MDVDTHFVAQAIRNYYADFMRLKTAQTPPGDTAYVNLLGELDMMVLAYPRLFIPLDKK
jgi:hypothetical protein